MVILLKWIFFNDLLHQLDHSFPWDNGQYIYIIYMYTSEEWNRENAAEMMRGLSYTQSKARLMFLFPFDRGKTKTDVLEMLEMSSTVT